MSKVTFIAVIAVVMIVLLSGNRAQGGVSVIVNGSFEDDDRINDITVDMPHGWYDVYWSGDNFGGWVNDDWSTYVDGGYSLTLYSRSYRNIEAEEMIMISQQVYLEDVNHIVFDIKLGTEYSSISWEPDRRTAILLIDDNIVWSSDELELNQSGEYTVDVNEGRIEEYKDEASHKLSLAMKSDIDEYPYLQYWAQWDFVKFDAHCGGFGYLPEDLDQSCYVDMNDLKILAERWLTEKPSNKYDLYEDDQDIINLPDFAVLANAWLENTDSKNWPDDNCYDLGLLATDLNNDGIVNFYDFAILVGDWDEVVDYNDIFILAYEWLEETGLYDLE